METTTTTTNNPNIDGQKIRLDDINLERKAAMLPEKLRDPFMFLGVFCRDECNADTSLLTEKMHDLHIGTDKSTWIRILKGQFYHSANGTERESPIMSPDRFIEEVQCLQNGVRMESTRGRIPFVMTGTAKQIFRFIDIKRQPERVNRFGVLIGPTGSQKTATLKEYARRNNHGTCIWLEAPENGSMGEFIASLALAYGGPKNEPTDRRRRRIMESFNKRKAIILDNCQRLYSEKRGSEQPLFGFLQRLQDECEGTIILSITPAFEKTLTAGMMAGFFEQFEGRAGGKRNFLRLPDYAPAEDVVAIAEAFGMQRAKQSEKYLEAIARESGRIRRLFEDLQDAKLLAESDKKPLTLEYLKAAREEEQ